LRSGIFNLLALCDFDLLRIFCLVFIRGEMSTGGGHEGVAAQVKGVLVIVGRWLRGGHVNAFAVGGEWLSLARGSRAGQAQVEPCMRCDNLLEVNLEMADDAPVRVDALAVIAALMPGARLLSVHKGQKMMPSKC
jgi:hypothetical protein